MSEYHSGGESQRSDGYVALPGLPGNAMRNGKLVLNRHSTFLTRDHDFPGAKVSINLTLYLVLARLTIN